MLYFRPIENILRTYAGLIVAPGYAWSFDHGSQTRQQQSLQLCEALCVFRHSQRPSRRHKHILVTRPKARGIPEIIEIMVPIGCLCGLLPPKLIGSLCLCGLLAPKLRSSAVGCIGTATSRTFHRNYTVLFSSEGPKGSTRSTWPKLHQQFAI